ncbi:SMI1/KNR4 family protein [Eikenella sp. S3360]|uniref:SMI1/KNR4 family protein n=1 Tax=Eikenella glucosivorans TaxID=2766967 RepID=A0ABS0NBR1_9NEIS|nr:SMI1/KNR4 family protein [Eikenella glucosivorans]MBH5329719.1 SMI1/KNR4 family protein [Eikenella glucosivorans]
MTVSQTYLAGLQQAYARRGGADEWARFAQVKQGISPADAAALQAAYPHTPAALLELLAFADGTYWHEYQGQTFSLFLLGSDVMEYPYYLLSARQMLESKSQQYLSDYIARVYPAEDVAVDERITRDAEHARWLHFSDCMNNGGTSQLFIDFTPSPSGKAGQIVRYLHDPDELSVIADSFEEYLQHLIEDGYDFIQEDYF